MSQNSLSQSTYQPLSLFTQCLEFVAKNLDHVEHFLGFPALVGEKIFRAAEETSRMTVEDTYALHAVKTFSEAFQDEVLSSLDLSGQYLGLNFYEDHIRIFCYITQLDMSDCGLGDDHEMLLHIGSLERLTKLSLRNDTLSNKGIQKMTACYRMFDQGPKYLSLIDLSENMDITSKSLNYLSKFKNLNTVIITSSSSAEVANDWREETSSTVPYSKITNIGWASRLVQGWMKKAEDTARRSKHSSANQTASRFYSGRRKENLKSLCQLKTDNKQVPTLTVVLKRRRSVLTDQEINKSHERLSNVPPVVTSKSRTDLKQMDVKEEDAWLDSYLTVNSSSDKNKSSHTNTMRQLPVVSGQSTHSGHTEEIDEAVWNSYLRSSSSSAQECLKRNENSQTCTVPVIFNSKIKKRKLSILDTGRFKRPKF